MFLDYEKVGPAPGTEAFEAQVKEIVDALINAVESVELLAGAIILYCLDPFVSTEAIHEAETRILEKLLESRTN
jgi:hypothetical protein